MSKPKILVYSTQYLGTGGIENHLNEFCRQMSKEGVEIDLIILNFKGKIADHKLFHDNCRNTYLCYKGRSVFRVLWLIKVGLLLFRNKYDALYTNGQGKSIKLISKFIKNQKWVHHHHTSGDLEDQISWDTDYKKALLSANLVIACSSKNAKDMELALNRNISSVTCFSRKIKVLKTEVQVGKVCFGYFGRLIPEKGVDLICRLSEDPELLDMEFHLWGEGSSYPESFFQNFPNVKYHGTFNGIEELQKVINSLNAFLLLSKHPEGLPISLLECMSAGLPWLATNRGGIPDIACDPLATRIISSTSTYDQIKESLKIFAKDIMSGKISRKKQIDLYDSNFSSRALIIKWKELLGC